MWILNILIRHNISCFFPPMMINDDPERLRGAIYKAYERRFADGSHGSLPRQSQHVHRGQAAQHKTTESLVVPDSA